MKIKFFSILIITIYLFSGCTFIKGIKKIFSPPKKEQTAIIKEQTQYLATQNQKITPLVKKNKISHYTKKINSLSKKKRIAKKRKKYYQHKKPKRYLAKSKIHHWKKTKRRKKSYRYYKKAIAKKIIKDEPFSIKKSKKDPELLGPQTTLKSNPLTQKLNRRKKIPHKANNFLKQKLHISKK